MTKDTVMMAVKIVSGIAVVAIGAYKIIKNRKDNKTEEPENNEETE